MTERTVKLTIVMSMINVVLLVSGAHYATDLYNGGWYAVRMAYFAKPLLAVIDILYLLLLLKNTIYYYLFLFMYIGIIISITLFFNISLEKHIIKTLIYILSSCILFIFSKDLWKIWKSRKSSDFKRYYAIFFL